MPIVPFDGPSVIVAQLYHGDQESDALELMAACSRCRTACSVIQSSDHSFMCRAETRSVKRQVFVDMPYTAA